jgi:CubicO group peptidase (beta-lactamase class C family)
VLRANGGIHSSAEDMRRWADALLAGRVLSPASMRKLWTPYANQRAGFGYAYGWDVRALSNGDTLISHTGGNGIFSAHLMIVPRRHIVMFTQTNVRDLLPMAASVLEPTIERMVSGTPYPMVPGVVDVPASQLSELTGTYRFDANNAVDVAAGDRGLRLTAQGWDAFALVASTRDVDLQRCREFSVAIEGIVSSMLNGDFAPLADAYEHRSTPESLQSSWQKNMDAWVEKYGKPTGFEVIGTAMLRERDMTLMRYTFEKGHVDRAYVWEKDERHTLVGVSGRGMSRDVQCLPVAGGEFASWEPRSGDSRPLQFTNLDGIQTLRITSGGRPFLAQRAQ